MSEYDFDVPLSKPACSLNSGRAGKLRQMPVGASAFFPMSHKSNVVVAQTSQLRKQEQLNLVCRRVIEKGVEGFRVWRFKDEEK